GASKGGTPAKEGAKTPAKDAAAKEPAKDKPKPAAAVSSPKSHPASNGSPPKTAKPAKTAPVAATDRPTAPASARPLAAPVLAPATRQHAAPRKPVIPAAASVASPALRLRTSSMTLSSVSLSACDVDDVAATAAGISDPVARKLAEWIILRSEDNGATVERYRAFISANPTWPSQTFLRRRLEAAMWDDRRDDSVAWSWFENESPISAKGRFTLAKAMLARGDRANAERLV
ncbi:lytic transglycosylase domain-containing protein, partial [Bradyrhizobium sp. CNPSo 4019]|nr:lytic transglycosylase domain-containing protein [Bradyrhizobium diversitatis]